MSEIKSVKGYKACGHPFFDIVYMSGKTITVIPERLPQTARKFMQNCTVKVQYNNVFKRQEYIYEKER